MRLKFGVAVLALSIVGTAAAEPPKLAVLIVVDQMRADYVDRFQGDWTSGLKRLVTKGAWFARAAYPYLDTVTCAGHATIGTGAYPSTHGVFQNAWIDRQTDALTTCTQDASVRGVPYGKPVAAGESARRSADPVRPASGIDGAVSPAAFEPSFHGPGGRGSGAGRRIVR